MTWSGIVLNDELMNGRDSGTLSLNPSYLHFESQSGDIFDLPLKNLILRQGGAGNRYVYFTHPDHSNLSFYTDELSILTDVYLIDNPYLKAERTKLKRRKQVLYGVLGSTLALILIGLISLFLFKDTIVRKIADSLPPQTEQSIGSSMYESAVLGKNTITSGNLIEDLNKITLPLTDAYSKIHQNDTSFHFQFSIVEDPTLNAFALPGGYVVINSGLINASKSPEELAGVLAHEISHVTERHHIRSIINNIGILVLAQALMGDATAISSHIAGAGLRLKSLEYSRDHEREADEKALELLLKAQINPRGMINFFETMKEESKIGEMVPEFLSTHPNLDERIETLNQKLSTYKMASKTMEIDYSNFKYTVKQYFNIK